MKDQMAQYLNFEEVAAELKCSLAKVRQLVLEDESLKATRITPNGMVLPPSSPDDSLVCNLDFTSHVSDAGAISADDYGRDATGKTVRLHQRQDRGTNRGTATQPFSQNLAFMRVPIDHSCDLIQNFLSGPSCNSRWNLNSAGNSPFHAGKNPANRKRHFAQLLMYHAGESGIPVLLYQLAISL